MYGKYPVAPSLTAYLTAQNANAYSMVHVDDSHTLAKMYEGSFTVQVWYRADGAFMAELAGAGLPYVFTNHNWSLNLVQGLSASKFGLRLVYNASDQSSSVSVDDALDANTWTHLAVQRDNENGVWRLFVNGVARVSFGNPALALLQMVTNGLTIGPGGASTVSFSDFQVYSAAVAPHFPTGKGVCAPPKSEFLLIWLPLDRVGEQVDASGFGHAASATGSWVATAVTAAVIDPHARTSPPAIPSDAPCGAWANYDGCDAPEPAECSACLSSAGFDTGECGLKAVGGVVRFVDGFTTHTFTMNETFTVLRADLRKVEVLVVGAGGGGGAVGTGLGNAATGANGGGGGFVTITTVDVSKGATFQITVGAGGTGSSAVSTGGADGGQSEFGAIANATSVVTALGGGGGASNVEKSSVQGGWGESNAGAAGAASHGNYDATGVLGYGNWRDFAGDAIIASTSGAPTAYAGGDGCCVRDPDPQKGNGCSAGSETGGDAKPVCLFGKCDGHQNSGGGGGVALVGQSGDGADGVVVVRYQ